MAVHERCARRTWQPDGMRRMRRHERRDSREDSNYERANEADVVVYTGKQLMKTSDIEKEYLKARARALGVIIYEGEHMNKRSGKERRIKAGNYPDEFWEDKTWIAFKRTTVRREHDRWKNECDEQDHQDAIRDNYTKG